VVGRVGGMAQLSGIPNVDHKYKISVTIDGNNPNNIP